MDTPAKIKVYAMVAEQLIPLGYAAIDALRKFAQDEGLDHQVLLDAQMQLAADIARERKELGST